MCACGPATTGRCCCCRSRGSRTRSPSNRIGRQAAVDPRGPSFGTTLTREQLEALSDDPEILRQQLQDMAGPGAVIKVDSFEGGALPPKAQIRSIRISRDQFAAENHSAGGTSIEIITQPGLGPIRYNTGIRFRGGSLSGRSPFTPTRGPGADHELLLRPERHADHGARARSTSSSTALDSYETPNINVALAGRHALGSAATADAARQHQRQRAASTTRSRSIRRCGSATTCNRNDADNLGIGEYDEEERAYSTENHITTIRAQHMGPLGRRAFTRSRLQVSVVRLGVALGGRGADDSRATTPSRAAARRWPAASTRAAHRLRLATSTTSAASTRCARASRSTAAACAPTTPSNYLGTYTFESLDAFRAGRPRSYTRRIGDPNIRYQNAAGRRLRAGRHPGAAEPDAQRRRALRGADARRRLRQPDAARRRHLGAVRERRRRRCDRAGASSTTGCRPTPTSRRCAWTASASGSWTSSIPPYPDPSATTSASRRRSTATCSATTSSCRARPGSASASISASHAAGPDQRDLRLPARLDR